MTEFFEPEQPITLADIEEIEALVGLFLPTEYKEHLLRFNGGRCEPNIFFFNEGERINASSIHWFYAINPPEYYDLKDSILGYKIEQNRMPKNIVPIACDPGGNAICISCGEKDYGFIYFWDHELEIDYDEEDDDNYSNLYFLASSFKEFIDGLVTREDMDKRLG